MGLIANNQDAGAVRKNPRPILNEQQELAVNHKWGACFVSACPGSGKCIVGDSLVLCHNGFGEIQNNPSDFVKGFDREGLNGSNYEHSIKVTEFVDSGIKPTLKLETEDGFCIQGTHHHPIAILNSECQLEWRELKDIQEGDFAVLHMEKQKDDCLSNCNESLDWYLMGLMLGDGYLICKNQFTISTAYDETERYVKSIVKRYYDYDLKVSFDKRRHGLRTLGVFSKSIKYLLQDKFGNFEHLACDKFLTREMLKGSRTEIGLLIQGLFDSNGYVSGRSIEICLCSERLIRQLQIVLLNFGVFSVYRTKEIDGQYYHRLYISGMSARRFASNVGFRLSRKKKQLASICDKNYNANRTIPFASQLISQIYEEFKKLKPDNYDHKTSCVSDSLGYTVRMDRYTSNSSAARREVTESASMKILDACKIASIDCNASRQLSFLVDNFEFSCVSSMTDGGLHHVYDYSIDESHNFIANGFVNHNTKVITERAARLIEGGLPAKKILCITFTNKAAQEMKERLIGILGDVANEIYVSTFHAMGINILRKFGKSIGYSENITVLDDDDQISLMSQCARQMGYDLSKDSLKSILYTCNNSRENLLKDAFFDSSFRSTKDANIANEYISRMKANNQTDFSGILSETIRLLETDRQVCQTLMRRFDYLQVDESQDTNYAQFRIVELLGGHGNIFMVGDIHQSIYKWRGARYENIKDFISKYKATVIDLPINYRSTPEIVKAASSLIQVNEGGYSKTNIRTVNASGSPVKCFAAETPDHEAMMIASYVERLSHSEGYKYDQFAVLYRANAMSRALETAFVNRGVPYQVIGGFSFFKREEIKDALAMLRFYINPFDSTALERFINKPSYSLGQVTLGKIENYATQNKTDLISALINIDSYLTATPKSEKVRDRAKLIGRIFSKDRSGQDIGSIIDGIVKDLDYEKWLEVNYKEDADDRKSTLNELINSATRDSKKLSIPDYLSKIALMTTADKSSQAGSVTFMTIHASKGLEFPVVFLPRLEEGKLPHTRSSLEEDGVEEERRLCYVAMTRAEKVLITSYSKNEKIKSGKFLKTINNRPSRFLFESNILKEDYSD